MGQKARNTPASAGEIQTLVAMKSSRSLWTEKLAGGTAARGTGVSARKSAARKSAPKNRWNTESLQRKLRKTPLETLREETAKRNFTGRQMVGCILGIDPSLRGTGLAVIRAMPSGRLEYVESLTVKNPPKLDATKCLAQILEATEAIIGRNKIDCVSIEQSVYVQNFRTAIILGASRGAAIAACARAGLEVFEYPPLRIKQAVIGYGLASKQQVAKSVADLVDNASVLPSDEADAAAAAITHIFTHKV